MRRDRRIALDQRGRHAAQRFDAQRQRRHVQQEHVLYIAAKHAGLNRRANADDFIRVDTLVRLATEEFLDRLLNGRHAGHTAHQDDLGDLGGRQPGVLQGLAAGLNAATDQRLSHLLQLGAGQVEQQILRDRKRQQ